MVFHYKDIPVYYTSVGKGPATVFLHGFLESSKMWEPLLPDLSQNKALVALDLPGHGKSGVFSEIHSMELMAEVVNALMLHLKFPSATIVGHSMGGYVALAFAELFHDKTEKLVLLNATPTADSAERKANRNRALQIIDRNPKAYISMAIGNLAGETSREKFSKEIEHYRNLAYTFPVEGIKAAIHGMRDRKDRTRILKEFPREKYMLLAGDDTIVAVQDALKIAESCGVKTKVVGGGHLSVIENLPAVREFLLSV